MTLKLSYFARKTIIFFWVVGLLCIFGFLFVNKQSLNAESIKIFLEQFGSYILIVYFLVSSLRGLTLIPSTPFILAGLLLFPGDLLLVYVISLLGVFISVSIIYFFSKEMGFEEIFLSKHAVTLKRYKIWLEKYGFWAVAGTSFVLFVPTDAIAYVAGTLKMNYLKFITGVLLGEGVVWGIIFYYKSVAF